MKQLIPQSKIDEAAREASTINKDNYPAWEILFKQGVQFALNEIQPFVCEFAEFIDNQYKDFNSKSGKQLLDEFINYKNK